MDNMHHLFNIRTKMLDTSPKRLFDESVLGPFALASYLPPYLLALAFIMRV